MLLIVSFLISSGSFECQDERLIVVSLDSVFLSDQDDISFVDPREVWRPSQLEEDFSYTRKEFKDKSVKSRPSNDISIRLTSFTPAPDSVVSEQVTTFRCGVAGCPQTFTSQGDFK